MERRADWISRGVVQVERRIFQMRDIVSYIYVSSVFETRKR